MSSDTCSTRRHADVLEIQEREDAACRVMKELLEQEERQSQIKQERVSQGDSTNLLSLTVHLTVAERAATSRRRRRTARVRRSRRRQRPTRCQKQTQMQRQAQALCPAPSPHQATFCPSDCSTVRVTPATTPRQRARDYFLKKEVSYASACCIGDDGGEEREKERRGRDRENCAPHAVAFRCMLCFDQRGMNG